MVFPSPLDFHSVEYFGHHKYDPYPMTRNRSVGNDALTNLLDEEVTSGQLYKVVEKRHGHTTRRIERTAFAEFFRIHQVFDTKILMYDKKQSCVESHIFQSILTQSQKTSRNFGASGPCEVKFCRNTWAPVCSYVISGYASPFYFRCIL